MKLDEQDTLWMPKDVLFGIQEKRRSLFEKIIDLIIDFIKILYWRFKPLYPWIIALIMVVILGKFWEWNVQGVPLNELFLVRK